MKKPGRGPDSPPPEVPSRRASIIGWSLFLTVDFATRLTVYADVRTALLLTLALAPLVLLVAQGLSAFYRITGANGRMTPQSFVVMCLSCVIAALLVSLAALALRHVIMDLSPMPPLGQELRTTGFYFFMIFLSFSFIQVSLAVEAGRRDQERRAARAEAEALRAELQRLRLQLDPHFLLNALNGIIEEVGQDQERAQQVLEDLSIFLQHALSGRDQLVVSLGEELDGISAYLAVQKARFGQAFDASIDVPAEAFPRKIASFLLQPLVENAVLHGCRNGPTCVHLKVAVADDRILIELRNPGRLQAGIRPGTGIGLATVTERLELQYPGHHRFELIEAGGDVVARLTLEGEPCSGQ